MTHRLFGPEPPAYMLGVMAKLLGYSAKVNPYQTVEDKMDFEHGWLGQPYQGERKPDSLEETIVP